MSKFSEDFLLCRLNTTKNSLKNNNSYYIQLNTLSKFEAELEELLDGKAKIVFRDFYKK